MSPDDDFNGDVGVERLDIVTDAKIDAAVNEARKAYFTKLVSKSRNLSLKFLHFTVNSSNQDSVDNQIFKRFGRINKGACKRAKVAPDSIMQVLFQIAYRQVLVHSVFELSAVCWLEYRAPLKGFGQVW